MAVDEFNDGFPDDPFHGMPGGDHEDVVPGVEAPPQKVKPAPPPAVVNPPAPQPAPAPVPTPNPPPAVVNPPAPQPAPAPVPTLNPPPAVVNPPALQPRPAPAPLPGLGPALEPVPGSGSNQRGGEVRRPTERINIGAQAIQVSENDSSDSNSEVSAGGNTRGAASTASTARPGSSTAGNNRTPFIDPSTTGSDGANFGLIGGLSVAGLALMIVFAVIIRKYRRPSSEPDAEVAVHKKSIKPKRDSDALFGFNRKEQKKDQLPQLSKVALGESRNVHSEIFSETNRVQSYAESMDSVTARQGNHDSQFYGASIFSDQRASMYDRHLSVVSKVQNAPQNSDMAPMGSLLAKVTGSAPASVKSKFSTENLNQSSIYSELAKKEDLGAREPTVYSTTSRHQQSRDNESIFSSNHSESSQGVAQQGENLQVEFNYMKELNESTDNRWSVISDAVYSEMDLEQLRASIISDSPSEYGNQF